VISDTPYPRLVLATVFWGGTFVAGRGLADVVEPLVAAWLRFTVATVLLLAWLYLTERALPRLSWRQAGAVMLLGATGVVAYNLLFFGGLQTVEAGRAALIVALNPIAIAVFSAWLFDERLRRLQLVGIVLSLAGAMVVIARGDPVDLLHVGIGAGELMLLGCVVSWVLYTLIGRRLLNRLSPLVTVSYASLAGSLVLGLLVVLQGGIDPRLLGDIRVIAGIGYLAVFGTVLAFVWYYTGVQAIGATRAAQFINLVPVSGVLLGVLVLQEPLTTSLLTGAVLVVVGLVLTNRRVARS
jgi:drug/metabolite transporter (DMT)-like permease